MWNVALELEKKSYFYSQKIGSIDSNTLFNTKGITVNILACFRSQQTTRFKSASVLFGVKKKIILELEKKI